MAKCSSCGAPLTSGRCEYCDTDSPELSKERSRRQAMEARRQAYEALDAEQAEKNQREADEKQDRKSHHSW
jgi:hypothetical protein